MATFLGENGSIKKGRYGQVSFAPGFSFRDNLVCESDICI